MTRAEAEREWILCILPLCKEAYEPDGVPDYPARRESWNNYTDRLCKAGEITERQYESWTHPRLCSPRRHR